MGFAIVASKYFKRSIEFFKWNLFLKIILWIHRICGLTFGGLTIDSKGKISVNKFYKFYGYLIVVLLITLDSYQYLWSIRFQWQEKFSKFGSDVPEHMIVIISIVIGLSFTLMNFIKWSILLVFNIFGYKFFKRFVEDMYTRERPRVGWKYALVTSLWFIQAVIHLVLGASTPVKSENKVMVILSAINFNLSMLYDWTFFVIIWNISNYYSSALDEIGQNLKDTLKSGPSTSNFEVKKIMAKKFELSEDKKQFIAMRDTNNGLDSNLSFILVFKFGINIFLVMAYIYIFAIISKVPQFAGLAKMGAFAVIILVLEIVLSAYFCGSVHEKSEEIYAILDSFNGNDMSDKEYKEWVMFKSISRKTKFGFTIGGFASIRKTTLITIFTFILNYTVILLQTTQNNPITNVCNCTKV